MFTLETQPGAAPLLGEGLLSSAACVVEYVPLRGAEALPLPFLHAPLQTTVRPFHLLFEVLRP
jgi:hypothetical protein